MFSLMPLTACIFVIMTAVFVEGLQVAVTSTTISRKPHARQQLHSTRANSKNLVTTARSSSTLYKNSSLVIVGINKGSSSKKLPSNNRRRSSESTSRKDGLYDGVLYEKSSGKKEEIMKEITKQDEEDDDRALQQEDEDEEGGSNHTTTTKTVYPLVVEDQIPAEVETTDQPMVEYYDKRPENSVEYQLYNNLIGSNSRYLKHVRPVLDHRDAIIVEVGMSVMMIEELIERDQIMIMAAAIKMKWTDCFLSWNPERYGNLTWLAVSSSSIWVPDISIVNSPEPFSMTRKVTHVDIDHNGEVGFYPSGRLTTRCNLHITYFPFDHQHCEVFLESWIHPNEYLKIVPYEKYGSTVDIKEYYTNHQWAILSYEVNMGSADYDGKNFSSITFVYMLKRKSQYYFMYFIFPQLLLAFLQTLSHVLPVEHPGRMAMLTSLFIGTSVTQAGIQVHIPKSSESMSLLQIYMVLMSVNLALALLITFIMMYAVLRYPNEEPSMTAITIAFFSIVWPAKEDNEKGDDAEQRKIRKSVISQSGVAASASSEKHAKDSQKEKRGLAKLKQSNNVVNGYAMATPTRLQLSSPSNNHITFNNVGTTNDHTLSSPEELSPSSPMSTTTSRPQHIPLMAVMSSTGGYNYQDYYHDDVHMVYSNDHIADLYQQTSNCEYGVQQRSKDQNRSHGNASPQLSRSVNSRPCSSLIPKEQLSSLMPKEQLSALLRETAINGDDDHCEIKFRNKLKPEPDLKLPQDHEERRKSTDHQRHHDNKKQHHHPSFRGQVASMDETRDLKRRWLIYCVAVDKTIMYAQAAWNIAVPLVLFVVIPATAAPISLHLESDGIGI